jgi:hypothetical protein
VAALRAFATAAAVLLVLLLCADALLRAFFPHLDRLSANFSGAYLRREVRALAADRDAVVFLGDSALWGYRVEPGDAAVSLLRRTGCDCHNLSFEGGSPANTYAMLRVLFAAGAAPKAVVFNVNQKEFNPADSAYRTLHPSVAAQAAPLLAPGDAALLAPRPAPDLNGRIDGALAAGWLLYGLRSDVRELVFGDVDAVHALNRLLQRASGAAAREDAAHRPTADRFEGTYDLTPLATTPDNVSVVFLRKIGALLAQRHVRAYAVLTPTNHALLHDYIDVPAYGRNLRYTTALLRRNGVTVLNEDRAVPADQFIDNDHLTIRGNRTLAGLLAPVTAAR